MKVRLILKITGWLLIIGLGVIHFLNREDLSVWDSGFNGIIYGVGFLAGLGLVFFTNSPRKIKKRKTGLTLICMSLVFLISGMILIDTLGSGVFSLSFVIMGVIVALSADFITAS
ncbi:hypothetical protein GCM10028778_20050 [Barrientosiimonas marina]